MKGTATVGILVPERAYVKRIYQGQYLNYRDNALTILHLTTDASLALNATGEEVCIFGHL